MQNVFHFLLVNSFYEYLLCHFVIYVFFSLKLLIQYQPILD